MRLRMKNIVIFAAAILFGVEAQTHSVRNLGIEPTTERGYVEVTIETTSPAGVVATRSTGPICGPIDVSTAFVICQRNGWLASVAHGTTGEYGIGDVSASPVRSGLSCSGYAFGDDAVFTCSLESVGGSCDPSQYAAVTCYFTPGQIAGIAMGGISLCIMCIAFPTVLCCVVCLCCAARKKY